MKDIKNIALKKHLELAGKLSVVSKEKVVSKDQLSIFYTPGVGEVSRYISENPSSARDLTGLNNSVAIISDGSAVLGLGDIGPAAALPVMEGKALLFKEFAGIDGYPVVLNVHTADEIVSAVKAISGSYGAINLEDIAAPLCFEVEDRLKKDLSIPVMHDDQHGTAVVVLAGLINSVKVTKKDINNLKIVIVGAGAAGTAIAKLINLYCDSEVIMVDSKGIISKSRTDLNSQKIGLLKFTNQNGVSGSLNDALSNADVFVGVSKANLLSKNMILTMNSDPIIFAMANPDPEILPKDAKAAGAAIIATGRSDFPNQVNNALAFPGIFRGALDNKINKITDEHKIAAAKVIAGIVKNPTSEEIIPDIFNKYLVKEISKVII